MRGLFLLLLAAVLAACGETRASNAPAHPPEMLVGQYNAASSTAREATGAVSIERGGLLFSKGVVLYTRTLNPRSGLERIARDGQSYASIATSPDLTIELRRVTEQVLTGNARGLCGDAQPGYVALAYGERANTVTVLVFAGSEPPGPNATQSRLCATLAYTAPGGARTSQGVVL